MSYIDKNSNVVVSARMTNEGRKLLSLGLLNFSTFRLGDSEIDYKTLGPTYDITLENIIRAKADNPDIKTALLPSANAISTYMNVPQISPIILETLVNSPKIGFFDYYTGSTTIEYTAYTDTVCHVLQADAVINVSTMTGGTQVYVSQAPTYGSNTYEPQVGDLMAVKMSNDVLATTQNKGVVELNTPVPYLWYEVQNIVSGTLAGDDLIIQVDRNIPNFPSYTGSNYAWTTFYPLGTGTTKDSLFSSGGFFSGGCVWNMNNVWSYPIPGVNSTTYETFTDYGSESYVGSKEYFGYTSGSGNTSCNLKPAISIIHYTNDQTCANQSELKYGQKFYVDPTLNIYPKLELPTLMWHRNTGSTIGQIFSGTGSENYVTLSGQNTSIYYYNMVDQFGTQVGRVYPELQMFTIDDQELVAALSYKSNRNWTLPTLNSSVVASTSGVIDSTENLYVTYLLASNTGYTSGLHCQNFICVNFKDNTNCPPTLTQAVQVQFPVSQLPFMKVTGGTGWYADTFYILAQKQQIDGNGVPYPPSPTQWKIMDYTSNINGHTVGNRIDPINLEASTFTISSNEFNISTPIYNLNNFITIPQIAQTNNLQFGDERFLFGNIESIGVTDKYRTKFVFTIPPSMFNTSTNPTWVGSSQNVHISEVGVYDLNKQLVAIGKMNLPIEKVPSATIIIEIAFDL